LIVQKPFLFHTLDQERVVGDKMKLGMNTERQEIYLPDKTRSMS
jgi:hypothetical protein